MESRASLTWRDAASSPRYWHESAHACRTAALTATGCTFTATSAVGASAAPSIIDREWLRSSSTQDGSVRLTFNGEIYNFQELRRELVRSGHRFRTRSDTEIIIRAYEQFGRDCVRRLRGMFAFGLWDGGFRLPFLARDHVGKKCYTMPRPPVVSISSPLKFRLCSNIRDRSRPGLCLSGRLSDMVVPSLATAFWPASVRRPPLNELLMWAWSCDTAELTTKSWFVRPGRPALPTWCVITASPTPIGRPSRRSRSPG